MKLRFVSSRDVPTLAITTNQNLTPKAVSEGVRNFKDEQPGRKECLGPGWRLRTRRRRLGRRLHTCARKIHRYMRERNPARRSRRRTRPCSTTPTDCCVLDGGRHLGCLLASRLRIAGNAEQ